MLVLKHTKIEYYLTDCTRTLEQVFSYRSKKVAAEQKKKEKKRGEPRI